VIQFFDRPDNSSVFFLFTNNIFTSVEFVFRADYILYTFNFLSNFWKKDPLRFTLQWWRKGSGRCDLKNLVALRGVHMSGSPSKELYLLSGDPKAWSYTIIVSDVLSSEVSRFWDLI